MAILIAFLGLEGQTSSSLESIYHGHLHNSPLRKGGRLSCSYPLLSKEVRHEDEAMAPASDEDIFVGSFKCAPFQNRADLLFPGRSSMIISEERNKMTMVITSSFLRLQGQTSSSREDDGIGHLDSSLLKKRERWPLS